MCAEKSIKNPTAQQVTKLTGAKLFCSSLPTIWRHLSWVYYMPAVLHHCCRGTFLFYVVSLSHTCLLRRNIRSFHVVIYTFLSNHRLHLRRYETLVGNQWLLHWAQNIGCFCFRTSVHLLIVRYSKPQHLQQAKTLVMTQETWGNFKSLSTKISVPDNWAGKGYYSGKLCSVFHTI